MSGTSLDGISAAAVRFHLEGVRPRAELLAFRSTEYTPAQRARLADALRGATPDEYTRLDFALGGWLAEAAVGVIAEAGLARDEITAIASHGHTVWHTAPEGTWQFGQPAVIAERTGIPVVADFRVRDVAAGGQGAPLVSLADALLFAHSTEWIALQNIGGIGNVTVVPPGGSELQAVRACDTGPGMCVIDGIVRACVPGIPFDRDGAIARQGTAVPEVVEALLAHPYFAAPPPKSTGRELFTSEYIADVMARVRAARPGATDADCVATAVLLTARAIALTIERFFPEPVTTLVCSGGGARNPALLEQIAAALPALRVERFDTRYFDGEAKEAVAFALLGLRFLQGEPGNVVRVTGARGPRVLGSWTPGA
jgi:anhydro-N-acetylmuramic acid kinase